MCCKDLFSHVWLGGGLEHFVEFPIDWEWECQLTTTDKYFWEGLEPPTSWHNAFQLWALSENLHSTSVWRLTPWYVIPYAPSMECLLTLALKRSKNHPVYNVVINIPAPWSTWVLEMGRNRPGSDLDLWGILGLQIRGQHYGCGEIWHQRPSLRVPCQISSERFREPVQQRFFHKFVESAVYWYLMDDHFDHHFYHFNAGFLMVFVQYSQIIHVWYIYLHLPHKWPKCS